MKKRVTKSRVRSINYGYIPNNKYYSGGGGGIPYSRAQEMAPSILDYYQAKARAAASIASIPIKTGHDTISYVNGGRDAFNPCVHSYGQTVLYSYAKFFKAYNASTYYYSWFVRDVNTPYAQLPAVSAHCGTSELLKAQLRAWYTMQPRFESEFSLLNFLFELHELKGLAKMAHKLIQRFNMSVRNIYRRVGPTSLTEPTGPAANLILTWNLGIAPLLGDLSSIWGMLQEKISQVLADFQADGADLNTRYYSEVLAKIDERSVGTNNDYMFMYGRYDSTVFHATMDYTYEYKRTPSLSVLADYWGLTGDPEKLWNAIPFSFILDYFIKIGKAIHFMKRDKSLSLSVFNYGESIKTSNQSGKYLMYQEPNVYTVIDGTEEASGLVSGWESVLYNRYSARPKKLGMYVPKAHNPTDKQRLNIIALARASLR